MCLTGKCVWTDTDVLLIYNLLVELVMHLYLLLLTAYDD